MSTKLLLEEWLKNRNEQGFEDKTLRARQRHSILTIGELKLRELEARNRSRENQTTEAE